MTSPPRSAPRATPARRGPAWIMDSSAGQPVTCPPRAGWITHVAIAERRAGPRRRCWYIREPEDRRPAHPSRSSAGGPRNVGGRQVRGSRDIVQFAGGGPRRNGRPGPVSPGLAGAGRAHRARLLGVRRPGLHLRAGPNVAPQLSLGLLASLQSGDHAGAPAGLGTTAGGSRSCAPPTRRADNVSVVKEALAQLESWPRRGRPSAQPPAAGRGAGGKSARSWPAGGLQAEDGQQ